MDRVLAIAWLRFKLLTRKIQGRSGALNVAAAILLGALGAAFAAGSAIGLGWMVRLFVADGDPDRVRTGFLIVFYVCLFIGIVLPLLRGAMDQGFDASPFVLFPIGRLRLYVITLAASSAGTDHLLYYPTLLAVALMGVVLPGVSVAIGLVLIALLAMFLVVWGNLLTLLLVSVMRARRVREIVAVTALLLLIGASFVPLMMEDKEGGIDVRLPQIERALETTLRVAGVLPPSIAAEGLASLHDKNGGGSAWPQLLWLLLWNGAGLLIGYFVFTRHHLAERGVRLAPRRQRKSALAPGRLLSLDGGAFSSLSPEVRAVASKDLHYLLRSVVGRFILVMTPLFVLVMTFLIGRGLDGPVLGIDPDRLLLFGMLFYAVLFSNNFLYNSFAWEGDGVKSYFLSPVPLRRVLLGKNLAVWLYNGILFLMVVVIHSVTRGVPDPLTATSALFLYVAVLLVFTGFGNIFSIRFPTPRDISTTRNQPATISVVGSLVVLLLTGVLFGPFLSVPMLLGLDLLQPLLLAGLAAAMAGLYVMTLRHAERLFGERQDEMIEALKTMR